jgi:hypothetical protein
MNEELELQSIKKEISPMVTEASSYVVDTEEDVEVASAFLRKVKDMQKMVEDKRLTFTKPLNESLKNINSTFKEMKEPLEEALSIVTGKILTWKRAENIRIEAEQAAYRKIQEAEAELNRLQNKPVVVEEPIVIAPVVNRIGNMQTVKRWTFEVVDFAKVPDDLKLINSTAVNSIIREGIREVPGLKIYQEESLSVVSRVEKTRVTSGMEELNDRA